MANYASTRRGWGVPGSPGWEQSNLTSIQTPNGLMADVNDRMAPRFQGFVNDLAAQGYNINSLGGYNNRNIAGTSYKSQHAFGNAIDINPTNNPVVYANSPFLSNGKRLITDLPSNVSDMAAKWGVEWGGNWNNKKDPMHFEGTSVPVMPGVGTRAMYGNAADASDWEKERQATIWNNALNPAAQPSVLQNIASTVTAPFNAAQTALGNAYHSMFGSSLPASSPQVASNPVPPADVGAVAPSSQQPSSYAPFGTGPAGPLNTVPISGTVTASALPPAPTQMPNRPVSQTPLIVGTQVADTPPATAPSYAEGTLGHMLSRPQSAVMGSLAPSMSMTRTTAIPPSSPITAPTAQQAVDLSNRMKAMDAADLANRTAALKTALQTTPSSITAPAVFSMPSRPISPTPTAFAPTAPQTAPTVQQSPQQQTGQWVSDLKAMDAAEGERRMAALSMPAQLVTSPPTATVAPTPSLQAPSLSPSVPSTASASTPSLPSLSPSAPAINGQTTTGLFASNAGLPGLSAMMQGNRPTLTPENFAASLQPPTVPGSTLPIGSPANPVNGPPVAPPSTLSKITPTLGDIKTGLVGAKIGMGAGPIGAAAGFAIPVLGGIANRLGYGLNSPFFGGPTPNPGASPATQADVVAHAAPSVLAQVNRMGYGALPAGSDYHYGYSPFGSGISLVNNNDTEAHQIAATGPGLLGALGFGGPASAPSLAAQAAAARIAAANDAANTAAAAAANASQGTNNGNGNNPGSMNKGFGSSTNSNGRNGRNKNDNGNN